MTNERLKQVIQTFRTSTASYTSEHDPWKMLEPYNLQIEENDQESNMISLIVEKLAGSTEIYWKDSYKK